MPKWKEITPDFMQFENAGDSLEGELAQCTEIRIKEVSVLKWGIKNTRTGIITSFLGGVALDPMLLAVEMGSEIKLEFAGNVKLGTGYRVKTFKLYQAVPEDAPAPPKKP